MRIDGRQWFGRALEVPRRETAIVVAANELPTFAVPRNGLNALGGDAPVISTPITQIPHRYETRVEANQQLEWSENIVMNGPESLGPVSGSTYFVRIDGTVTDMNYVAWVCFHVAAIRINETVK